MFIANPRRKDAKLAFRVIQLPVLKDNYVYLLCNDEQKTAVAIDPAVYEPIAEWLSSFDYNLIQIWNTHHHGDHVGANLRLKEKYACEIYASLKDEHRIPALSHGLTESETFEFEGLEVRFFETPGHTSAHGVFWLESLKVLFCGDTLFSVGCGRLFEGSADQMWDSMQKILSLPDSTKIYCAHEYTQSNCAFALSIDPNNEELQKYASQVDLKRQHGEFTIPTYLGLEKKVNPFLRVNEPGLRTSLGFSMDTRGAEVFKKIRELKDQF